MKKGFLYSAFIVFLFLGFISCDSNRIFDENQPIDNQVWNSEDIRVFSFEVSDTLSPMNVYVKLRTTTDYPYSNIYMYMYSIFPNGTADKDTLEFLLAEPNGKWLGENSGTVVEFKGLIASGGRFSTAGIYEFHLQHAMREKELAEIVDVGIRVETMEMNE